MTVRKIMRRKDLTKPDSINILRVTDIHYVNTIRDGMVYFMSIKDCFKRNGFPMNFQKHEQQKTASELLNRYIPSVSLMEIYMFLLCKQTVVCNAI